MKFGMRKTVMIFFLIAVYLFSTFPITAFASDFSDVPQTHKNYLAITELADIGVIAGYEDGTFCPKREITRTEFCALMARVLGYSKESYVFEGVPFTDVKPNYWGEAYISYCYEMKLINGMGNDEFWPAAMVTMEQAVKMAVCAIGKEDEAKLTVGDKWYDGYIETANKYNLFYKVDGEIGKPAQRAAIAQIVYNMLDTELVAPEEDKPDPENESNAEATEDTEDTEDTNNDASDEDEDVDSIPPEIRAAYRKKDFLDVKTILVDAGHNYKGKDTGAENKELDLKEEEITWQIADKLRERLEDMGYNVVMTRDKITDSIANTSVLDSLQARVDLGHRVLADLFISIHCNAGGGSGAEVYCFSENGYAGRLAQITQKNIAAETGLYNRGVKTANFFVIQNTLMPAILIETGFIDHSKDAEILSSQAGQRSIAKAIADAVEEYDKMKITDFSSALNKDENESRTQDNTIDELRGTDDEK